MKTSLALLVLLALLVACDSAPTRPGQFDGDDTYQIYGAAVADFNRDFATVAALLQRDSAILPGAQVSFDGVTLNFDDPVFWAESLYSFVADPAGSFAGFDLPVRIRDSNRVDDTLLVDIPDTFSILTVEPPNRIVTGLQPVSLDWSGSDEAEGYIVAAVRRSLAYAGYGWSMYVTSQATAGTITPEAFSLSPGDQPDTGWYYVYVYSYTGAPDSIVTSRILPVPMPSQLPENIADDPWSGTFGAISVAHRDSVHVVTIP